jgi:hypothetical protein
MTSTVLDTELDAEMDDALPLLNQIAQLIPSMCAWDGNFQQLVVNFVHLGVFRKSRLDDEDIFDLVLNAEVMLQSLQEYFARDAALYPYKLGTFFGHSGDPLLVIGQSH